MKRSEINACLRRARDFMQTQHFHLPPFAFWSPEDWAAGGPEVRQIAANKLGWDITDFGHGDFRRYGLFLFTLRNGSPENWKTLQGKLYAEKIMMAEDGQETPLHFHWSKMEDIINRGGGNLMIQVFNALPDETLDESGAVTLSVDSIERRFPAGGTLTLTPGESVSLPQYCYHRFWAEGGPVLIGEVSLVNDDDHDNRFLDQKPRFPTVEEDEPPLYLLCTDYPRYYRWASEQ